jgi:23S rRNA (guanosine2251-2'-O)-methyltransferase
MEDNSEQEEIIFGKNTVLAFLTDQAKDARSSKGTKSKRRERGEEACSEPTQPVVERAMPERLHKGPHVNKIFISDSMRPDPRLNEIKRLASLSGTPVLLVERRKLDRLVGPDIRHQGVVAKVSQAEILQFEQFIESLNRKKIEADDIQALVIVDGIEDPHNLGAIVRVAEAAGFLALLLPIRRSASISATVAKTSAGATAHLPIVSIGNIVQAIESLKQLGFWIVGLAPEAQESYCQADLARPLAFVIGGEGHGLSRLVKEHCDFLLSIPMLGKTESLNASVAAGIVFYEFVRQKREKSKEAPLPHNSKH